MNTRGREWREYQRRRGKEGIERRTQERLGDRKYDKLFKKEIYMGQNLKEKTNI